ncbi:MAG TPA: beta-propeller fold lactonase family protein [Fimbriimonadaceae bacterium]|nr:beta-propeller fold lactonase family protein [Fimbriimonadaceae bacterium]
MLETRRYRRLLAGLGIVGIGLVAGCGGRSGGVVFGNAEYAYLATGTNVIQFSISSTTGQLTELIPNTAASTNAVAIATTGNRYAFAVNRGQGTVSQYEIQGDGTLKAMTPATASAGSNPDAIAVTSDSKFAYVLNSGDNTISEYAVAANGTLSSLTSPTIPVAADGTSLVITPNNRYLYATSYGSNTLSAYAIGQDGQLAPLTVPTYTVANPSGPAVSPNGNFLYVPLSTVGVAQFAIAADGSLTPLTPATVNTPAAGNDVFAVTPNGLYGYVGCFNGGVPDSPVGQFSVGVDGTLTALSPDSVAAGNAPYGIGIDPNSKYVYVMNENDGSVSEFSIGADGTLTGLTTSTINTNGAYQMAFAKR